MDSLFESGFEAIIFKRRN